MKAVVSSAPHADTANADRKDVNNMPQSFHSRTWKISDSSIYAYDIREAEHNDKGCLIASVPKGSDWNLKNARLVAAAPEMYKWIKSLINAEDPDASDVQMMLRKGKELLARIDGEETKNEGNEG